MSYPIIKLLKDFLEYINPEISRFDKIYQIYFFLRNKYNFNHERTRLNLIEYFNLEDDLDYMEILKNEFQLSNPTNQEDNDSNVLNYQPPTDQLLHNIFMTFLDEIHNHTQIQPPSLQEDVKKVLKPNILEELELIKYNKLSPELKEENKICPISSEEYKEEDLLRKLPCGHLFLATNVDKWLIEESHLCPLCRKEVGEYQLKF